MALSIACQKSQAEGAPAAVDNEHRGIAIAPLPTPSDQPPPTTTAPKLALRPHDSAATIDPSSDKKALFRAQALYLDGDKGAARTILEPRVLTGHGSLEEIKLLEDICREQADTDCVDQCKKLR